LSFNTRLKFSTNATISSTLPIESEQKMTNYWTIQYQNSMKPTPLHMVHFPGALAKILFLSNIDKLITSHNNPNNSQQNDLATMTIHESLNDVILSLHMVP
jgi:hypothetical protein